MTRVSLKTFCASRVSHNRGCPPWMTDKKGSRDIQQAAQKAAKPHPVHPLFVSFRLPAEALAQAGAFRG